MGAVATALALFGICGVVTFAVRQRTKEFGIRAAPGVRESPLSGCCFRLCATLLWVRDERSLITAFIHRRKRDRYGEMLSNPKSRAKFIRLLAHFGDFDSKYRVPLPGYKHFADRVLVELEKRQSAKIAYVISEDPRLDQKELPLVEALPRIVGSGMGTILCCIPGRLAFVETEEERFILERHDPGERAKYVRFVVSRKDGKSNAEQGVFQAAAEALESWQITGWDADELNELTGWFDEHLEKPTSFGRGRLSLGICWFKTGSTEHISRIRQIVNILERNGIYVKKIKTDKPGYVTYEDDWQLVAEPFRKGTISRG
jgi:hypothetical protein